MYSPVLIFLSNTFSYLNFSYSWRKLNSEMHFWRMFLYRIFIVNVCHYSRKLCINILKHKIKLIINGNLINEQKLISKNIYINSAKVNII